MSMLLSSNFGIVVETHMYYGFRVAVAANTATLLDQHFEKRTLSCFNY